MFFLTQKRRTAKLGGDWWYLGPSFSVLDSFREETGVRKKTSKSWSKLCALEKLFLLTVDPYFIFVIAFYHVPDRLPHILSIKYFLTDLVPLFVFY